MKSTPELRKSIPQYLALLISSFVLCCSTKVVAAESIYLNCKISGQSLGMPLNESISVMINGDVLVIESYDFPMTVKAQVTEASVAAVKYAAGKFTNGQAWNSKTDVDINRMTGMISIHGNVVTGAQQLPQFASGSCSKISGKAF